MLEKDDILQSSKQVEYNNSDINQNKEIEPLAKMSMNMYETVFGNLENQRIAKVSPIPRKAAKLMQRSRFYYCIW